MISVSVPFRSPSRRLHLARGGRLLRLELRHSTMIWLLPLVGALFYFDAFRTAMGYPPFWFLRASVISDSVVWNVSVLVAGVAAWAGSRDGRRQTVDLVTTAARPRWGSALVSFAGTLIWALVAFFGCVAALYGATATQATWGGPPWWPVAAGAAVVSAFCALGFAAGWLVPGRFTAPLAALGAFLVLLVAFRTVVNESHPSFALLSPGSSVPPVSVGVFSPYLPDLYLVQVMFYAGIAVVVLGGVGLASAAGSNIVWRAGAVVAAVGLAATATAVGLVGTARTEARGVVIPAVHDAASDRPIAYTPVCQHAAIPVCVHPAFRSYLPDLAAALNPLLRQVAGLPGAPVRVEQTAPAGSITPSGASATLDGSPPVVDLAVSTMTTQPGAQGYASQSNRRRNAGVESAFVNAVVGGGSGKGANGDQAQEAIGGALLDNAGAPRALDLPSAIAHAAARFAGLAPSAQRAWLAAHLVAVRSGHVTLAQVP